MSALVLMGLLLMGAKPSKPASLPMPPPPAVKPKPPEPEPAPAPPPQETKPARPAGGPLLSKIRLSGGVGPGFSLQGQLTPSGGTPVWLRGSVRATLDLLRAGPGDLQVMVPIALQGTGMWASPRPFGVFKNNEREIHHPLPTDSRYAIHERLWANAFRMFLFLMNDELGQTGKVFDRAYTLKNVNWIYNWFSVANGVEVGQAHPELDAVVTQLRGRLASATELTTVRAVATAKGDYPEPVALP